MAKEGSANVEALTQDCFNAVIALRHVDENSSLAPEKLQREVRKPLDRLVQKAGKAGIAHQDAQDMLYAIVALVDEMALKGPSEVSQYWIGNMLQMSYFRENMAGEGFFTKLEEAKSGERYDVLKVYYICLLFGFLGRYGVRGGDSTITDLISSTKYLLAKGGLKEPETLSPAAERPKELMAATSDISRRFLFLPIGALVFAVALYIGLSMSITSQAHGVTDFIETLLK